MKLYRSYSFRTKDPAIDELRTIAEDHFGGRIRYKHLTQIERDGGPSATSMRNWFFGKTRRPQSATMEAMGRTLGFKRAWVPNKKS